MFLFTILILPSFHKILPIDYLFFGETSSNEYSIPFPHSTSLLIKFLFDIYNTKTRKRTIIYFWNCKIKVTTTVTNYSKVWFTIRVFAHNESVIRQFPHNLVTRCRQLKNNLWRIKKIYISHFEKSKWKFISKVMICTGIWIDIFISQE